METNSCCSSFQCSSVIKQCNAKYDSLNAKYTALKNEFVKKVNHTKCSFDPHLCHGGEFGRYNFLDQHIACYVAFHRLNMDKSLKSHYTMLYVSYWKV